MKIHEDQAKEILRRYGVPTPLGRMTTSPADARVWCEEFGGRAVVKAQIHAGGRGKGGGVKLARSGQDAERLTGEIIGMRLVTPQTGPQGREVEKVLIEEALDIDRELYLGILLDRDRGKITIMASAAGGMDIEEVAAKDPGAILRVLIDPVLGIQAFQARTLAAGLGLTGKTARQAEKMLLDLYRVYLATDASLVEVNPLMITKSGDVYALDAKMNFDDNALFRHPEIAALRDLAEEEPLEIQAAEYGLNYIKLDGNIGCMVNGAGLAMATMDIIQLYGGAPANFLDVGGSASQEAVTGAFKILVSDPNVKTVLINIFGGIARTDRIARGVVAAIEELRLVALPVVVRLEGTNVEEGRQILKDAAYDFKVAEHMADAAQLAVAAAQGANCWRSWSVRTRACWCRGSPARKACSTPRAAATTARWWWAG